MIRAFAIVAGLLAVFMVVCIVLVSRIKKDIVKSIRFLFAAAIMTMLCNVGTVLCTVNMKTTTLLLQALYLAFTDWLVVALFLFARNFTGYFQKNLKAVAVLSLLSVADTIFLLLNQSFGHIFTCEWHVVQRGVSCYLIKPVMPGYLIHMLIVYSMALFVGLVFFVKARKTLKLYRKKYNAILYTLLAVLAANVIYNFIKLPIDISVTFYGISAAAIGYFGVLYVPRDLPARLLSFSVKDMSMGILCYDFEGNCIYVNDMAKKLFGQEEAKNYLFFEEYYAEWLETKGDEELEDTTWREQRIEEDGSHYYETKFKRMLDETGNVVGSYFSIADMTEEVAKYEKEHYRATHDHLTGILNWIGFMEEVHRILEKDSDTARCIVCIDIRDFKLYNTMFGVEAGDELLKNISAMMQKESSEGTVYGRLAGDKFVMFMEKRLFGEERMTNYIKAVAAQVDNEVYHIHIQMGVYFIKDTSVDVPVMCDCATLALGSIKSDYQKYIAYYDKTMGDTIFREKRLLNSFEDALDQKQFQMYLQPQIASDGTLLGAEALVRWLSPGEGLIPPGDFIPLFEKTGYIHRLDLCIWELACEKLAQWKKAGREDLHISVNISAKDFYYLDLYETFTGLVEKYDFPPKNLKLEITETAVMTETSKHLKMLDRLRDYGFHIEIDDFGSGYSSLNTLKDMNVDVVKMDMGFLRKTDHPERSRIIMNTMIAMSKELGIAVITEGVETEEQVEFLKEAGCDMFQGYYFDKPMPAAHFEKKYKLE